MTGLLRRRASVSRPSGSWDQSDYDVFDRINATSQIWWWGVSFMLTGCESYGDAPTREAAMAAFKSR